MTLTTAAARAAAGNGMLDRFGRLLKGTGSDVVAQRRALAAFAIRVASAAVAYFSQVVLARLMGAFEFGIFAYVWVWVVILGTVVTAGYNTSVMRFVPEYLERRQWGLLHGFVTSASAVALGAGTLTALAGIALVVLLDGYIDTYYVVPLILALACLPSFALSDTKDGLGRARGWIDLALAPAYIVRPVLILAFMVAAVAAGAPATAATAASVAIAATWLVAAGQTLLIRRRMTRDVPAAGAEFRLQYWTRMSVPIVIMDSFYLVMAHADILILTLFVGPSDVAIYYAVVKTTSLIAFVYFSVTAACGPKFSELNAAGRRDEVDALLAKSIAWTFWPSLAATAGILAIGVPLLWLFGPDFTAGYPLMFILAAGLLARAATGPVESMMNMLGHQDAVAWVLAAAVLVNVSLNVVLIPLFGLAGAAVATSLSMVAVAGLQYAAARRHLGVHALVFGRIEKA
jgi:O-antigen/teichoic acid export membrane protein